MSINRIHEDYLDPDKHLWSEYDDSEPEWSHDTDPYHYQTWVIGSDDDFWCFDFATAENIEGETFFRLHAVINSETGSFIMNAEDPIECPAHEAVQLAQSLVDGAVDWCAENEVEIDAEGWNTKENDFVKAVAAEVARVKNRFFYGDLK